MCVSIGGSLETFEDGSFFLEFSRKDARVRWQRGEKRSVKRRRISNDRCCTYTLLYTPARDNCEQGDCATYRRDTADSARVKCRARVFLYDSRAYFARHGARQPSRRPLLLSSSNFLAPERPKLKFDRIEYRWRAPTIVTMRRSRSSRNERKRKKRKWSSRVVVSVANAKQGNRARLRLFFLNTRVSEKIRLVFTNCG